MKKIFLSLLILLGLSIFGVTTNVQASSNENPSNIKIDGNFDDWSDKPITNIISGNGRL
ncbi:hypothetical protein LCR01_21060 [Companilactobacillus crustorum]|uniref:Uncharacterized protein n=2 Tax=Companilactobacillus crustorum TaxID=392416 RepID=A0A837RET0_9LACO|nr:hypothetical protein [Companilactobacillus crustorum]APU71794.1 hypothetical protein BI355_1480 [Companilactobacillus crustorum]KRK40503.1 hypothetical protein FD26_GL002004 [Companilactobacillus crustorum JCM 15951]KRO16850.1 hypothetical protein IV63_GL002057 [Companilactobacillus crustorum]WDT64811.1 hypothetical protein NV391_07430 [Companilactobacillus crustorum]GEO77663.1 hypothetical protein LCR01_21060 [Companilactobacillus crustorum]